MYTMHSTLLVGRYDWEPGDLPRAEFEQRIAALWDRLAPEVAGIAAYGDRRSNAELVYLTHFVPKLRDGLALIPRFGQARLHVAGASSMMAVAARQTWVQRLEPLSEPGKVLAQWRNELGGPIVLVGGANLRLAQRRAVDAALGAGERSAEAAAALASMMRTRRPRELAAIRQSCAMLGAMAQALGEAQRSGRGASAAVIDAEHAAHRLGAQEVRSLFSLDGGRTLRPFVSPADRPVDPLQAYLAVRHAGYWAEGFVSLGRSPGPAAAKAAGLLKTLIASARPGARCSDLARRLRDGVLPLREHEVTAGSAGTGIGLALEQAPSLSAASDERLEPGDVCSLRAGVSDGAADHAIVSAMVAVGAQGSEVLWSA